MAPHSSTPAWRIPWTEEPGRLQSMGSLRVGHDWATSLSLFPFMHWRKKWQPTAVFLPGESQGRGSLVGCHLWGLTESDTTEVTQHSIKELTVATSSSQQGREGEGLLSLAWRHQTDWRVHHRLCLNLPIWSASSLRVQCLSNQCSTFHIKMRRVCELSCNSVTCCNSMWFWIWFSVIQPHSFKGKKLKKKKSQKPFF